MTIIPVLILTGSEAVESVEDCYKKDNVCFGSLNNETAWSMQKDGCIKSVNCQILLRGSLSNDVDPPRIEWSLFLSRGSGTATVSITDALVHGPFNSSTDYFYTEISRNSGMDADYKHMMHSTGPGRNSIMEIPCEGIEIETKSCPVNTSIEFTKATSATDVTFWTLTKSYNEIKPGVLRPYISYVAQPLNIHLRAVRDGKVVELVTSKGPYWLFNTKDVNNNPDRYGDKSLQWSPCKDGECPKEEMLGIKPTSASTTSPSTVTESSNATEKASDTSTIITVVVVVVLVLVAIGLLFLYLCKKRRPQKQTEPKQKQTEPKQKQTEPKKLARGGNFGSVKSNASQPASSNVRSEISFK